MTDRDTTGFESVEKVDEKVVDSMGSNANSSGALSMGSMWSDE